MKTKTNVTVLTLKLTNEEENVQFDAQYPERRRGTALELLRLIYDDPANEDYDEIEVVFHKTYVSDAAIYNPSIIPQQVRRTMPGRWNHYHAYRKNDEIYVIAGIHPIERIKTFPEQLIAMLQNVKATTEDKLTKNGQDANHLDLKYSDLPQTYQQFPMQIRHRLAMRKDPVYVKIKPFREFVRIWLLKSPLKTSLREE